MEKRDVLKLWDMLDTLYTDTPADKRPARDDKTIYAWQLALEPYTYEDIKRAALEHVRKNRFYPAIAELITNIVVAAPAPTASELTGTSVKQAEADARQRRWYEAHVARRHALGLPTGVEAKKRGIPFREYCRMVEGTE